MFGEFVLKDEVQVKSNAKISILRNSWGKNVYHYTQI
jgi:hypothetical protein